MKKIFSLIAFALLLLADYTIASADKAEEIGSEESRQLEQAVEVSKAAFLATNDYHEIINNKLYAVAAGRLPSYRQVSQTTRKFLASAPNGVVKRCAWHIDLIITERLATLESFVYAMNSLSEGNNADYSYYSAQMQYHGDRAYDLLQQFHRKYHF